MRRISQTGLDAIKQFEGLRLNAYDDGTGVWTIGYGHTRGVRKGDATNLAGAENMLRSDLREAEDTVSSAVKVSLNDNQFAALVSFVFNVGAGNFRSSSLLRKLNAGDYNIVPRELSKWNRAKGKILPGLVTRRAAEAGLWAKGGFVQSSNVDVESRPVKGGIKGAGAGVALAAFAQSAQGAADKLSDVAASSPIIGYAFTGLTMVGLAGAAYGVLHAFRSDSST